ncbi:unnamed protein product [Nippostrongylus brasiliensis]|uniref:TLDc domain-containing protein n=1 Tax=Nippostrongylus brasiliensis TaxID=27835 RepID=A0A0N4YTM3_NIPBR|nr:unnamed protein product [Nippostrongylus brasiliensis]
MGNFDTKCKDASTSSSSSSSAPARVDKRAEQAFVKLTGNSSNHLTFGMLKEVFSEGIAESLWKHLSDSKPFEDKVGLSEFSRYAPSLWGTSTDIYIRTGAGAVSGDEKFIGSLVHDMCKHGTTLEHVVEWKNSICPSLCNSLRDLVLSNSTEYSSGILTPMQMWSWTPLYSSGVHGISVNRFENNVFDYRGPTVSIFHLTDKRLFVIATEDVWRHSASRFGGPGARLMQISPELNVFYGSNSIYCNFKIRSAAFGLSFTDKMKIDKDMGNVAAVEVNLQHYDLKLHALQCFH